VAAETVPTPQSRTTAKTNKWLSCRAHGRMRFIRNSVTYCETTSCSGEIVGGGATKVCNPGLKALYP
jgi:hypothetical protein